MFGKRTSVAQGFGQVIEMPIKAEPSLDDIMENIIALCKEALSDCVAIGNCASLPRAELADKIDQLAGEVIESEGIEIDPGGRRDIVTVLLNDFLEESKPKTRDTSIKADLGIIKNDASKSAGSIELAKKKVQPILMDRMDVTKAIELPRQELSEQIGDIVAEILGEEKLQLNMLEQRDLVTTLINDMLGLGPLEQLLQRIPVACVGAECKHAPQVPTIGIRHLNRCPVAVLRHQRAVGAPLIRKGGDIRRGDRLAHSRQLQRSGPGDRDVTDIPSWRFDLCDRWRQRRQRLKEKHADTDSAIGR